MTLGDAGEQMSAPAEHARIHCDSNMVGLLKKKIPSLWPPKSTKEGTGGGRCTLGLELAQHFLWYGRKYHGSGRACSRAHGMIVIHEINFPSN